MDCSRFLDEAKAARRRWGMIILDPPVFSNSAKFSGVLDLRRDAAGLVRKCLALLEPGGVLYFSGRGRSWNQSAREAIHAAHPRLAERAILPAPEDADLQDRKLPPWVALRAE
jgi:23S rRNA G2069 N7-methylase RlmK/C1962 C5-methylase RlmI